VEIRFVPGSCAESPRRRAGFIAANAPGRSTACVCTRLRVHAALRRQCRQPDGYSRPRWRPDRLAAGGFHACSAAASEWRFRSPL